MKAFTDKEQEIMNMIVDVHNLYADLESTHDSDLSEWVLSIHNLQRIVSMRILRRELPDIFISHNKDSHGKSGK